MTNPFREKIRGAIANPSLQVALDGNAERRRAARLASYPSLPEEVEQMRRRAHLLRQQTIQKMDQYLEQFITNARANGWVIHHADTAEQAVKCVLDLVHQAGGKKIVKSKTMVGEEIEINAALEKAGMQVTETDLGEWIVQMRGERPGHILTPAVHLRRDDVARLFTERLGIPYTEDVEVLVATARRTLRKAFLEADIGISGVNFGIADQGTVCLLTNEGNGRLVTTLPPVHIALMGIERLVPNIDDLALMLYLLPRASSGQHLTVYTSLIRGPRQPDENEGPLQRHLVLLDNGRRALSRSPLAEALYCVRCGACLNECPVFREIGGHAYVGDRGQPTPYSGPIGSVLSPGLFGVEAFGQLARASSLCGACKDACPVDIDLPKLLLRVRAGETVTHRTAEIESGLKTQTLPARSKPVKVPTGLNWGLRAFAWLAVSPRRFAAAQRLAGELSAWVAGKSGWLRLPAFTGWGVSRDLPAPAQKTFQERWREQQEEQAQSFNLQPDDTNLTAEKTLPLPKKSQPAAEADLVKRFAMELEALGGTFIRCTPQNLHQRLMEQLALLEARQVQAWEAPYLAPELLEALVEGGIEVEHSPSPEIPVGITGALAGVAETGTLVLPGGVGRAQRVSMLPDVHLAVLPADRILESLPQALNLPEVRLASNTVLISGPSRTADIEMTLTIGAHGPRQVIVLCVEESD